MTKGQDTKARIIEVATRLFQAQGCAATGLKQILEESDAPRGSFYFHFPQGKDELTQEVVSQHAQRFAQALEQVLEQAPDTSAGLDRAIDLLIAQVERDITQAGCPVMSVALELTTSSSQLRAHTREALEQWRAILARKLEQDGRTPAEAMGLARAMLGAIEGALAMCKTYQDTGALEDLRLLLPSLVSASAAPRAQNTRNT